MPPMLAPESGVAVRMYRQRGLGDCFLLAFRDRDGDPVYMLVDCGVFFLTTGGSARMKKIAEDIEEATGGHLHVLVATHEHYDHVSGFGFADSRRAFERIDVDEVWVAWTEDPDHELAERLREEQAVALRALHEAVTRLDAANDPRAKRVARVLDFFGEYDRRLGASSTKEQFEFVKTQWGTPRFLHPGQEPLALPSVDGVRVFVLGPPEDEGLLKRSNPSESDSEVYEEAEHPPGEDTSFYAAVLGASGEAGIGERAMPFDSRHRIRVKKSGAPEEHAGFFRDHYGWTERSGHGPSWRRVQTDWLRAAGHLALQLDNHVNNTSLALAIEVGEEGGVILLPGDAQVGNWLSWHSVVWNEGDDDEITGTDLVRRTALYKVGHHASHNATLREKGLELMERSDLVAMVPVDERQAREDKGWKMPFDPLYERLLQKTRGRIVRADDGVPSSRPASLTQDDWNEFLSRIEQDSSSDELWVQYRVPLD